MISRPRAFATPSRFARFTPDAARIALAVLAMLFLATALSLTGLPQVPHDPASRADVVLYETVVQGMRGGGDYYSVAAQALRAGDYPMRSFLAFPLPTLAVVQAWLPQTASLVLLYALAAGVMAAWYVRLAPAFARAPPRLIALALLASGLVAVVQDEFAALHEAWAGLLIALSLAVRREDRWIEAVAIGLVAMLIRETALLYVGIMAVLAFAEGRRREALGWGVTVAVFAGVIALHAHAVAQVLRPTDPDAVGWGGMPGVGVLVTALQVPTVLDLAPAWLAALLVGLALFGWAAWATPLALRALAILCAYAVVLGLFGHADTPYWGLMIAPTLLIGLAFVPDGVRDLIAAARTPRRKITITRVVR